MHKAASSTCTWLTNNFCCRARVLQEQHHGGQFPGDDVWTHGDFGLADHPDGRQSPRMGRDDGGEAAPDTPPTLMKAAALYAILIVAFIVFYNCTV